MIFKRCDKCGLRVHAKIMIINDQYDEDKYFKILKKIMFLTLFHLDLFQDVITSGSCPIIPPTPDGKLIEKKKNCKSLQW